MDCKSFVVLCALFASALAFAGEFVPKSYYVIDHNGHKSNVIYFRSKRDVELFPLLRMKRSSGGGSGGNSGASSYSYSSSSSSGGSGGGGGGGGGGAGFAGGFGPENIPFFGGIDPGFVFAAIPNAGPAAYSSSFASADSSGFSGIPAGGHGGAGNAGNAGYQGPILFSRMGEDQGTGINVGASAQGQRGAFSSSSSSIDSNGKIKYSVQSGKY